jgi:hypothetical protein
VVPGTLPICDISCRAAGHRPVGGATAGWYLVGFPHGGLTSPACMPVDVTVTGTGVRDIAEPHLIRYKVES